jgi:hypothetical protein
MLKYANYVSQAFAAKVVAISSRLGINPDWLMVVMAYETQYTFKANKRNGNVAVGLIQFTNASIAQLNKVYRANLTKDKLAAMTELEQLDWVEKYLAMYRSKLKSLGDLYSAVFNPSHIGKSDNLVLYKAPSTAYSSNRGFDSKGNMDGRITLGEVRDTIYAEARKVGLSTSSRAAPETGISTGTVVATAIGIGVLAMILNKNT